MIKLATKDLKLKANDIRQDIINMLLAAGSGHSAGPLDMADIFAALYFNIMNVNPQNPKMTERDYLVLSCGHICPVLYAAMAEAGYFPKEELLTLRKLGTRLHGHPHNLELPGIETSSGPLSQGSSQAVGIAWGLKMDKKPNYVYLVVSDGEQQEGQTWEAAMLAGKYHLDNLIAVMDRNRIQIDGDTEDVMPLDDLKAKYESFNWHVLEIDGNNMEEVLGAFAKAKTLKGKPIMILANTLSGKGVSFMEGDYKWHGNPPNKEQAAKAIQELQAERKGIV
jgi:transketolase